VDKGQKLNDYYEDEIDLYELWLIIKKRKAAVILTTLLFLFVGVVYSVLSRDVYRIASIVFLPQEDGKAIVSFDATKEIIDSLNSKFRNEKFKELSKLLNVEASKLKTVSNVSAEPLGRRGNKEAFLLEVDGYDKRSLPVISNATVEFLKSNPLVKEKIQERKKVILTELNTLEKKLPSLQSDAKELKKRILNSSDLKVLGINPLDIETSVINLKNRIAELKYKLNFGIQNYEILFSQVSDKPVKPKKGLIIAVSLVSGLFLGIFLAFFFEWLENVRERYRQSEG